MKMVHALVNGEDASNITIGGGGSEERKLTQKKSSNIGNMGTVNKNSRAAELEKMINANKDLSKNLE